MKEYTQYELKAFNGDYFLLDSVKGLLEKYKFDLAIETGTYLGHTTKVLGDIFQRVISTEINEKFIDDAVKYIGLTKNVTIYCGDSPSILNKILFREKSSNIFFFLDSHWYAKVPLIPELQAISKSNIKPVILIHDFFVPNKSNMSDPSSKDGISFGFDIYNGQAYTFPWVKPHLDNIYGVNNYKYYYNEQVAPNSARRGCLFVEPLV